MASTESWFQILYFVGVLLVSIGINIASSLVAAINVKPMDIQTIVMSSLSGFATIILSMNLLLGKAPYGNRLGQWLQILLLTFPIIAAISSVWKYGQRTLTGIGETNTDPWSANMITRFSLSALGWALLIVILTSILNAEFKVELAYS